MSEFTCPHCGGAVQIAASQAGRVVQCESCGGSMTAPATAPPPYAVRQQPVTSNPIDSIIPVKNVNALIAYYVGVFSIIPCLGPIPGIVALILGIKGLKFANAHPEAKGKVHALVGIIAGTIFTLLYSVLSIPILQGILDL